MGLKIPNRRNTMAIRQSILPLENTQNNNAFKSINVLWCSLDKDRLAYECDHCANPDLCPACKCRTYLTGRYINAGKRYTATKTVREWWSYQGNSRV